MFEQIKAAFLGAAIGDALGVPVEFSSREALTRNPVKEMTGYGTWNQPPGTFSDDSSMLFCTAESLCNGFDIRDIANQFIKWYEQGFWGAHNEVFDIGGATRQAIIRVKNGTSPEVSGGMTEHDNGNGSLMRILPLVFFLADEPSIEQRFKAVKLVSGITHHHFRSVMACFIYTEFGRVLLQNTDKFVAYRNMQETVNQYISNSSFAAKEIQLFDRILQHDIVHFEEDTIQSSGYVLHTLESSIWCFLTTNSYSEAVLKAVNLGGDTDTTACVTGGLAGLYYGLQSIPGQWIQGLARQNDIVALAERFANAIPESQIS
ncbi:ADP-ribosylglycohydrolase family protein [Spirosoma daeguense]